MYCACIIAYYAGTCDLQPITAYRPVNDISLLLTECARDWQASDVAPQISLKLVNFIAVVNRDSQVACCNLPQVVIWVLQVHGRITDYWPLALVSTDCRAMFTFPVCRQL